MLIICQRASRSCLHSTRLSDRNVVKEAPFNIFAAEIFIRYLLSSRFYEINFIFHHFSINFIQLNKQPIKHFIRSRNVLFTIYCYLKSGLRLFTVILQYISLNSHKRQPSD